MSSPEMKPQQDAPLFQADSCLKFSLETDLKRLTRYMEEDSQLHAGILRYSDAQGMHEFHVQLKVRGHFRRSQENCDFPQLEINFNKMEVKNSLFEGQSRIKLATHCRSHVKIYEQNLLQEYIIYRMYNLLTDLSYRVRLAQVKYINNSGRRDTLVKYAFFLENRNQLLKRNQVSQLEQQNLRPKIQELPQMNRMAVFQFMVANTDWSIPYLHNITLVRDDQSAQMFAIPYDFEWSGIINANYAKPQPLLGITSVRERLYRGYCMSEEAFDTVFNQFRENRDGFVKAYKSVDALENKYLEQALDYLDEFYRIIDDPKLVKKDILQKCHLPGRSSVEIRGMN